MNRANNLSQETWWLVGSGHQEVVLRSWVRIRRLRSPQRTVNCLDFVAALDGTMPWSLKDYPGIKCQKNIMPPHTQKIE
jgi:hypothetical protein